MKSARLRFVTVRTMVGAWPYLRVKAAGVGPFFVNRAASGFSVQKLAVTAGAARQAEDAVFEVEVLDQAGFA